MRFWENEPTPGLAAWEELKQKYHDKDDAKFRSEVERQERIHLAQEKRRAWRHQYDAVPSWKDVEGSTRDDPIVID